MKTCLLLLLLLPAFGPAARSATAVLQDAAAPGLTFEATGHDFGRIGDDHPVSCGFRFANASASRTITVREVKSSCGCTVAALEQKVYAPGEAGQIDVTFNPLGRQGPERKVITVTTDDPDHPSFELVTTANVAPHLVVEPRTISLGEVRHDNVVGTVGPRRFQVIARVPDVRITAAGIADSRFSLDLLQADDVVLDGETVTRWTYQVSLEQNVPIGRIQTQVTIETSDLTKPKLLVSVTVDAVGSLRVSPERINLHVPAPGQEFAQDITVARRDNGTFQLLAATVVGPDGAELPGFGATFEQQDPGRPGTWRVRLTGVGPAVGSVASGLVKFRTDVADQGEGEVPFTASIRPGP